MNKKLVIQVSPADTDLLGGWKQNKRVHADGVLYRYKKIGHAWQKEFLHRLIAKRMLAEQHKRLTRRVRVKFKDNVVTNCTRENILLTDYTTQNRQRKQGAHKSSQYRGVYRDRDRWRVRVYHPLPKADMCENNKVKYRTEDVGFFALDQEVAAAKAYDKRKHEVDPNAILNFPEDYQDVVQEVGLEAKVI